MTLSCHGPSFKGLPSAWLTHKRGQIPVLHEFYMIFLLPSLVKPEFVKPFLPIEFTVNPETRLEIDEGLDQCITACVCVNTHLILHHGPLLC